MWHRLFWWLWAYFGSSAAATRERTRRPQRPIYARVMLPSSSWRATDDFVWPCVEFGFLPGAHRFGPEGFAGHDRAIGFARRRAAARGVLADQQPRLRACAGLGPRRGTHSIRGPQTGSR